MYLRDFESTFNLRLDFPVIVEIKGKEIEVVVSKTELKQIISVKELIERLENYLADKK